MKRHGRDEWGEREWKGRRRRKLGEKETQRNRLGRLIKDPSWLLSLDLSSHRVEDLMKEKERGWFEMDLVIETTRVERRTLPYTNHNSPLSEEHRSYANS